MKPKVDRVGQVLLLLIGGGLLFTGGTCVINAGADFLAIFGLPFVALGVWIISLAKNEADEGNQTGQSAEKEKQ